MLTYILIFLHILFLMLTDTSGIHGMRIIPLPIWTIILSAALVYVLYRELYMVKNPRFPLLFFATIWAFFTSFFAAMDLSTGDIIIQLNFVGIVSLVSVHGVLFLRKRGLNFKNPVLFYTAANVIVGIGLIFQILAPSALPYSLALYELLIIVGIVVKVSELSPIDVMIVVVLAVIGVALGSFILRFDLPPTIVRTLIAQIFGLSSGGLFFISGEIFLMLHLAELFAVAGMLVLRRKWLWFMTLLTGLSYSYGPFVTMRLVLLGKIYHRAVPTEASD